MAQTKAYARIAAISCIALLGFWIGRFTAPTHMHANFYPPSAATNVDGAMTPDAVFVFSSQCELRTNKEWKFSNLHIDARSREVTCSCPTDKPQAGMLTPDFGWGE